MKIVNFSFLIIFSLLILLSSHSKAQKIGLRGGGNITTIIGSETPPYVTPKFSYNGGIYVEFPYTRNSSTFLELNYIQKGAKMRDSIKAYYDVYYEVTEKLHYISIPAIYRIKLGNKKFDLYSDWGLSCNILVDNKRTLYGENQGFPINVDDFFSEELKRYEIDAIFAIGMRYKNTSMDFRYNSSISNLYGGDGPIIARNNILSLNFAFQIHKIVQKTGYKW